MKLLYISTVDFTQEESSGVCRKIKAQVKAFRNAGIETDYTYYKGRIFYVIKNNEEKAVARNNFKQISGHYNLWRKVKLESYDAVYIRYNYCNHIFLKVLKKAKKCGCKIVVEIPTYPYDNELKYASQYSKVLTLGIYYLDIYTRSKMKKYVDLITTYSFDKVIFGIHCMTIANGIDFNMVSKISGESYDKNTINLIAVAALADWHGYDRIICGMGEYYRDGGNRNIVFHIVGEGGVVDKYLQLVRNLKLSEHVFFYGKKYGKELADIYEKADIGITSLGLHRKGFKGCTSELKSREYAAKGLPMITSSGIDVFPLETTDYLLKVSEDDSAIDMKQVVSFYDRLYAEGKKKLSDRIRKSGEQFCDMPVVMQPIIEYYMKYN